MVNSMKRQGNLNILKRKNIKCNIVMTGLTKILKHLPIKLLSNQIHYFKRINKIAS